MSTGPQGEDAACTRRSASLRARRLSPAPASGGRASIPGPRPRSDHGTKATSATPGRARRTSHPRPPRAQDLPSAGARTNCSSARLNRCTEVSCVARFCCGDMTAPVLKTRELHSKAGELRPIRAEYRPAYGRSKESCERGASLCCALPFHHPRPACCDVVRPGYLTWIAVPALPGRGAVTASSSPSAASKPC